MLHFELVTPERLVRSEEVHMVTVPGTEGEFGVLEGHAPVMSTIRDGLLTIQCTPGGTSESVAIEGGFAEVSARGLTVLAERAGPDAGTGLDSRPVAATSSKVRDRA